MEMNAVPNMRVYAQVPSETKSRITGRRPQPIFTASTNLMRVSTKRMVSNTREVILGKIIYV